MSLERIKHSILEKARKEAEAILQEAEENVRRKTESARAALKKDFEQRLKTREAEFEEEKIRQITLKGAGYRMQLLAVKNQILDRIFAQAIDDIIASPDERYLSLLEKWIRNIDPDHPGELFVNERDLKRIGPGGMDRINRPRKTEARIALSPDPVEITGGFVLKTEKFDVDCTLDTLIADLRGELTPNIAKELFDEKPR